MARILIAEDEEALCAMCARALSGAGHEVKTACDGSDALDLLKREDGRFDLLLTDIRMPIMDGIALSLAAARDYPDVTILLMTGYADQRERAHGLDAIIHDVITKPFTLAALRGAVDEALTVKARPDRSVVARIGPWQRVRLWLGVRMLKVRRRPCRARTGSCRGGWRAVRRIHYTSSRRRPFGPRASASPDPR